jgi:hypothetical protein
MRRLVCFIAGLGISGPYWGGEKVWCIFATWEWLNPLCRSLDFDSVGIPGFVVDISMDVTASAIKEGQVSCKRLLKRFRDTIQQHEAHYLHSTWHPSHNSQSVISSNESFKQQEQDML